MNFKRLLNLHLLTIDEEGSDEGTGGAGEETKETLDSAIEKASKELNKDEDSAEDDDKKNGEGDSDKEGDESEEESDEEDLTEEQQKQAKSIFKLLSNPETSVEALRTLAAQAGLKLEKVESKEDKKEAKKAINELIKEKVGPNYPHLAEILAELIPSILTDAIKENTKDIRENIAAEKREALTKDIKAAQESVIKEYVDVPVKVLQEFVRMQEQGELLPGPKQSPEKFFRNGIREAADNLKISLVKKSSSSSNTKSERKESPLDKLASKSRSSAESGKDGVRSTQVKTINDAIKLAQEALAKKG